MCRFDPSNSQNPILLSCELSWFRTTDFDPVIYGVFIALYQLPSDSATDCVSEQSWFDSGKAHGIY
jgi:hypothetical protein